MHHRLAHVLHALLPLQHTGAATTVPTAAAAELHLAAPTQSSSGRVLQQIAKGERGIPAHLNRQPTSFRPVHVGADGRLLPSELQLLEAAILASGGGTAGLQAHAPGRVELPRADPESKGYRPNDCGLPARLQELKQLLATLGPQPQPLTLEACTPVGLAAQRAFFREHGFVSCRDRIMLCSIVFHVCFSVQISVLSAFPLQVVVEGVLGPDSLRKAQAAFTEAMAGPCAAWANAQRPGGGRREQEPWFYLEPRKDMYINVPLDYAANPVLLEILDSPQLLPLVQSIMVADGDDEHHVTTALANGRCVFQALRLLFSLFHMHVV